MKNKCFFCLSEYISGHGEGSLNGTHPITFECGTYYTEEIIQSEECKKRTEKRFEVKERIGVEEYVMGMKTIEEFIESNCVLEMQDLMFPLDDDPHKQKIRSLLDKLK